MLERSGVVRFPDRHLGRQRAAGMRLVPLTNELVTGWQAGKM
jgi:hypothetical protein